MRGLDVGLTEEEAPQRKRLPQDDSESEDVGPMVDITAGDELRRHVAELAFQGAALRVLLLLRLEIRPRDAKVHDFYVALEAEQHVRRRNVAVDDVQQPALTIGGRVRIRQPLGHFANDVQRQLRRDALFALGTDGQQLKQITAVDELHDDVELVALSAEIEDLNDVTVLHQRRELCLGDEHVDKGAILGVPGEDPLDAQDLLEPLHTVGARSIDLGHAAGANLLQQLVLSE